MSKPFTFGIGKPKPKTPGPTKFSLGSAAPRQKASARSRLDDSDHEDEDEPKHESVTAFSADGAVLSKPSAHRQERIIQNAGNGDWRKRGKTKTATAPNGDAVVVVERNEVSTASGLQPAASDTKQDQVAAAEQVDKPQKEPTEDEEALAALLDGGSSRAKSKAVIVQKGNSTLGPRDEIADFRADVASRPDSSTLQDYAAMPVEEFGMAMLRGMGKKRRANGEVIDLNGGSSNSSKNEAKPRKHDGFLGIGAKPAPGSDIELGAWGKADMRKNHKGDGFFIPLMRVNEKTGEKLTEEELQRRIKEQKSAQPEEDSRADRQRKKGSSDEDDETHDRSKHDSRRRDRHDRRDRHHDSSADRERERHKKYR
ncbi:hypothetical protein DV735_g876, partial [Chaetothyriales sp. CBS 134920]